MEIDHLLAMEDGQLKIYNKDEVVAKINWWLDTPQGQRWGDPHWGHRLQQFKHDPISVSIEIAMEAHIYSKMREDLPLVQIRGIGVRCLSAGEVELTINTQSGLINTTFDRAAL